MPVPQVRFGMSGGMHPERAYPPEEMYAFAEQAERLGYDSLWLGDHIAFHGPYPESLATLAAFAARTRRITLGTCVYLLPLRRPAVAAKAAATVDFLSGGGRFVFGVGVGGEGRAEFELCGVPLKERGARMDESIEILRKLWTGEPVSHQGRFWTFGEARQSPPPATPGGPPIWIGGRSEAAQRRAARAGDGWVSYLFGARRYAEALDRMRGWAAGAGRELRIEEGKWVPAHHAFVCLHADAGEALRLGTGNLSRRYGMDFRGIAERYLFYGSPDRVAGQIEEFKRAGARHFIFKYAGPPEEEMDQMAQLAEDVVARARA
ncbi:MAG: TIGR03619 family F420-dependent LLM class oxidoreductase [Candidatus Tectomicrobia bacterium]|nr:TIGR03619 family F420-dependent LLM class oxidoreductase [Candidatus Tectomicrobia bacterium]